MRQLKQPIDYRVELMDTGINTKITYPQSGLMVHVIQRVDVVSFKIAVSPKDEFAYLHLMGQPNTNVIGLGWLLESVGDQWMVAWRPFSPAPELVPLTEEEKRRLIPQPKQNAS